MPGFHHSVAVLPLPFRRCKIPLFCQNYIRKFRSVTAVKQQNDTQRQRQRRTETATANGNGATAMEERHGGNRALCRCVSLCVGSSASMIG